MCRVTDNIGLAKHIANKFAQRTIEPFDDLFQAGCIGLMRADREYIEGDVPFGAFAGKHIQWEIYSLLKKSNIISEKVHIRDLATTVKKRNLLDEPIEETAMLLNRTEEEVERAVNYVRAEVLSLDYKIYSSKNGDTVDDFHNKYAYEVEFDADVYLDQLLDSIPVQYREALKMYYYGFSNKQIASKLGIKELTAANKVMTGKARIREKKEELLDEIYSV